ncbi:MAG: hypothetical protein KCHDKBKB_02683 [Elusimicrobia bacterium]|nr:hypothetical protein [Elusimicrobiota bacterium]
MRLQNKVGWILDITPVSRGMCVWILDADGNSHSYLDLWIPHFYLKAQEGSSDHLQRLLQSFQIRFDLSVSEKKGFFSRENDSVMGVHVYNPLLYRQVVKKIQSLPSFELFNADIHLGQYYFYERQLFPLAQCEFSVDDAGVIQEWHVKDSPWALIYDLPPLRYAHLEMESPTGPEVWVNPGHRRKGRFILTLGPEREKGRSFSMDASEEELVHSLNRHIREWDPDVLLTEGGDDYLLPRLYFHAERVGVPLTLSRKSAHQSVPSWKPKEKKARSFMTYGKMVYQAGSRTLFGRLHIDRRNSFTMATSGLDGLFEISRVAKIPIQRAARCTIGTSLSSMQHEWAVKRDILIPLDKGQTEDFRSGEDFIAADRGGLVYEPELGFHEDVIELDFSSMYPEIMVRHNVTPEAVNCGCCVDHVVPGLNHHLCRKRGMIPDVLEPLVKKRSLYKGLIKSGHSDSPIFKRRYDAFKWALVTSFGYLGFRNARFGKIEAHECVNAYGREALLLAKEVAEKKGFHFLHAIVDSLWLKKEDVSDEEVEKLRLDIEIATGLPIGLEGRYRWIHFCESKQKKGRAVPSRYFGAFRTGETKVRGIELRRHDTPLIVKNMQQEMLSCMAQAKSLSELEGMKPQLANIFEKYKERLRCGWVTPMELAISRQLRHRPEDYLNDTLPALAAKKMAASGIELHPGETISYVVMEEKDAVKDWRVMPLALIEDTFEYDVRYYHHLIDTSTETLFSFDK